MAAPTRTRTCSADATLVNGSLTFDKSNHDIPWGYHYYVFEKTPPTGYGTMSPNPIAVDATTTPTGADPTLVYDATDPQLKSTLEVIKHDRQTGAVVDGASFDLYEDTNGLAGLQTTAGGGTPADQIVGDCGPTTGGNPCSVGHLGFGTYWWYETSAPTGYALPADPKSGPIEIDASNAGTTFPVTVISDPEIPAHIKVVKVDKDTQHPLDGAKFTLYADSNTNGAYDQGVDQVVGAEHGTAGGEYAWPQDLFWGTYFVEETAKPDLYDFDSTQVKKVVIERKDAGTTVSVTFEDPQIRRTVTVDKVWFINGVKYTGGIARDGFSAALKIDGTAQAWGDPRGGYLMGQTATITEVPTVPANCVPVDARLTEKNGDVVDIALGENGYAASLPELTNHYTVTNTVTCSTRVTLQKSVLFGGASASSWNLSATGTDGSVTGTAGVFGSVPSAAPYTLAEADGTAAPAGTDLSVYQQSGAWTCITDGPNATSVAVVDGKVTPTLDTAAITCTVRNTTAKLTLVKEVENTHGGDLKASAWKLKATPSGAGLDSKEVTGSTSGVTVEVKPGATYSLTESPDGGNGYHLSKARLHRGGIRSPAATRSASRPARPRCARTPTSTSSPAGRSRRPTTGRRWCSPVTRSPTRSGSRTPRARSCPRTSWSRTTCPTSWTTLDGGDQRTRRHQLHAEPVQQRHLAHLAHRLARCDRRLQGADLHGHRRRRCLGHDAGQRRHAQARHRWLLRHRGRLLDDAHHSRAAQAHHRQGGRRTGLKGDADKTWWRLTADRVGGTVPATKSSLAGNGGDSGLVAEGTYTLAEADVAGDGNATSRLLGVELALRAHRHAHGRARAGVRGGPRLRGRRDLHGRQHPEGALDGLQVGRPGGRRHLQAGRGHRLHALRHQGVGHRPHQRDGARRPHGAAEARDVRQPPPTRPT